MIAEGSQLLEAHWPADTSQPVMETTVGGVLQAAAEAVPDRTGLVFAQPGDRVRRRWTFAELLTESERAACALLARFDPGEGSPSGRPTARSGCCSSSARRWPA